MVKFVVKSVVNICGKNCGEIEKLLDWNKNWCGKIQKTKNKTKNTKLPDSRTRGPEAPTVLVTIYCIKSRSNILLHRVNHAYLCML